MVYVEQLADIGTRMAQETTRLRGLCFTSSQYLACLLNDRMYKDDPVLADEVNEHKAKLDGLDV